MLLIGWLRAMQIFVNMSAYFYGFLYVAQFNCHHLDATSDGAVPQPDVPPVQAVAIIDWVSLQPDATSDGAAAP
jgi:hypothetical protein